MQLLRLAYWEQIKGIEVENLVFLDETGARLGLTRTYGRSLKGQRVYGERPYRQGESITLIGAMSIQGILATMTLSGGTTGSVFQAFIEEFIVPQLWLGTAVVMDNLPAHKVKGAEQALKKVEAFPLYLSPYSPDFNPIENCGSKLKEYLRSVAARTRTLLDEAINY